MCFSYICPDLLPVTSLLPSCVLAPASEQLLVQFWLGQRIWAQQRPNKENRKKVHVLKSWMKKFHVLKSWMLPKESWRLLLVIIRFGDLERSIFCYCDFYLVLGKTLKNGIRQKSLRPDLYSINPDLRCWWYRYPIYLLFIPLSHRVPI